MIEEATAHRRRRAGVAASAALALALGCKVDKAAFEARVFSCSPGESSALCGADDNGAPMTCYAASQLTGSSDFCAPMCGDTPMSLLPGEQAVCVQGGAKLKFCKPSDDADPVNHPHGACDSSVLGCLRTDVTSDEGVCTTLTPCSANADCADPVQSTCAATFLRQLYAGDPGILADHLYCLQEGCDANQEQCAAGQTCLRKVIPKDAQPPDICVPNCDSQGRCPPNHFCYQKVSAPDNPPVCIPGLLGFVCETDVDCLAGKCQPFGGGAAGNYFNLCTIDCASDADCTPFDSVQGLFACNAAKKCVTPAAFRGATCKQQSDCDTVEPGTTCTFFDPTAADGTCLFPCPPTGDCPAYGGVAHTCVITPAQTPQTPVCFPGLFGYPCTGNGNCVGDLSCRGADPATPGLCTALCASDQDCNADRWTAGQSYCGLPQAPFCVPLIADGAACDDDAHCASQRCIDDADDADGGAGKVCAPTPAGGP